MLLGRARYRQTSGRSLNKDQRDALDLVLDLLGEIEDQHGEARIPFVAFAVRLRLAWIPTGKKTANGITGLPACFSL